MLDDRARLGVVRGGEQDQRDHETGAEGDAEEQTRDGFQRNLPGARQPEIGPSAARRLVWICAAEGCPPARAA